MTTDIVFFILVALIFMSSLSGFFGANLPKFIWWISILSAFLSGFVFSSLLMPFPENLLFGLFVSLGMIFLVIILRSARKNHPR